MQRKSDMLLITRKWAEGLKEEEALKEKHKQPNKMKKETKTL
jgi:hypothetical protein